MTHPTGDSVMDAKMIAAEARKELVRNIAVAPAVLLVRLPLALIYFILQCATTDLARMNDYLPGWRNDYARMWRRHKAKAAKEAALLANRNPA